MWSRSVTLWLGLSNLLLLGMTWASTSLVLSYHLGRDSPDGVTLFAIWVMFGSPLLCLATLGSAAREIGRAGGRSPAWIAGLVCVAAAASLSAFAWISLLRHS